MKIQNQSFRIGVIASLFIPASILAAEVEQIEDLHIHTSLGTADNNAIVKLGIGVDNGDYTALLKWDSSALVTNPFERAKLLIQNLRNDSDGSFSIHQMLTDWAESTDFGTTLPTSGIDYVTHPIAAAGFNDANAKTDTVDIGKLVEAWVTDTNLNKGIIFIPRPMANASYPSAPVSEIQLPAHSRVPGLDTDDVRIITESGLPTFSQTILTPIEDSGISNAAPDNFNRDGGLLGVGLDGAFSKVALYKFGFGELFVNDPAASPIITNALFDVHSIDGQDPPTLELNVHRMIVDWDETTVTWNQFGTGGPSAGVHYETTSLGSVVLGSGTKSATIDITGTAIDWLQNPASNFGLIVVAPPTATRQITLTSSERVLGGVDSDDTVLILGLASTATPPPVIIDFQPDGTLTFQADDPAVAEYVIEESTLVNGPWSAAVSRIPPTNLVLNAIVPLSHPDAMLRVSGLPPTDVLISPVLPRTAATSLAVYDDQGRMVRTLWTGETKAPGDDVVWDGRNEDGQAMPVGTYNYKAIQLPSAGVTAELVSTVGNGIGSQVGNEGGVHGLDMSDVDVDSSGNIYLSGSGHGMSLEKFDSSGNRIWIHRRPSGPQGKRTTSAVGNGFVYGADPLNFFRVDANTGNAVAWSGGGTERNLGPPPIISKTYDRFGDAQELWVLPILEGAYWFPSGLDGLDGWRRPYHPNVSLVGGEMPPKRIRGMTVLGTEVFLSYTLEDKVEVRSGTSGNILRTIALTAPAGIVADATNNKLFVIRGTDIITMDTLGGGQATIVTNGLARPWGLAWNESSDLLYATDLSLNATTGHTIRVFSSLTGQLVSTFGDSGSLEGDVTATKLYAPLGIDVDSSGRILVAESLLHRLSIFSSSFVPDTAIYGGNSVYAALADPAQPERVYTIDSESQGSIREYNLDYTDGTWTVSAFWYVGGPHPTRDLIASATQGTHIRHIGGFTYLISYADTIKVYRIDAARMTPVAIIGSRFRVQASPGVFNPPGQPTIWADQNGDEIASPGEITHPTPAMIQNFPFLDLNSRYEDTFCDSDGTMYWGTFKLPLFNQQTNGVLEYRWEDLEHFGTDLDGIQDAFVCVDADPSDQRYYLVTELDNDLQQPGIGLHDKRTIDCYVRKYDSNGQLIWQTGNKAPTAHGPGEMYHPRGIETFEAGAPPRRFVAVNDEPGIVHFWNADGLYITTVLRDMSPNHPNQNFYRDFWIIPKYLSDPLVSTFGEFWHMSAEVHPTTGKVYIYTQAHEGGQHMRVYEIKGLDGITKVTGLVNL